MRFALYIYNISRRPKYKLYLNPGSKASLNSCAEIFRLFIHSDRLLQTSIFMSISKVLQHVTLVQPLLILVLLYYCENKSHRNMPSLQTFLVAKMPCYHYTLQVCLSVLPFTRQRSRSSLSHNSGPPSSSSTSSSSGSTLRYLQCMHEYVFLPFRGTRDCQYNRSVGFRFIINIYQSRTVATQFEHLKEV